MAAQPCLCYGAATIFPRTLYSCNRSYFRFWIPSSYNLHRRLIAPAARRNRRKWDSNAETFRTDFTPQDDDEEEDEDVDDRSGSLEEVMADIWSFKVLKSYGLLFPAIFMSSLMATGPKALLMALAIPVGQSIFSLAYKIFLGETRKKKPKWKSRVKRKTSPETVKNDVVEEETQVGSGKSRDERKYESWVVDGTGGQDTQNFAGWDDLTAAETIKRPYRAERSAAEGNGKLKTEGRRSDSKRNTTVGNGMLRTDGRRRRDSKRNATEGNGRISTEDRRSNAPLLLRLLIALFPIIGSWTKLFW